jgi:hypothetical protein
MTGAPPLTTSKDSTTLQLKQTMDAINNVSIRPFPCSNHEYSNKRIIAKSFKRGGNL